MDKIRYDGTSCLNLRTIEHAYRFFSPDRRSPGEPIALSELLQALSFLETFITSRRLTFDGTVPAEQRERAEEIIEGFVSEVDLDKFRPVAVKPETDHAFVEDLKTAGAALEIHLGNLTPISGSDRPLQPEAARRIRGRLSQLGNEEPGLADLAVEEARSDYQGAKLVAALYLNGAASRVLEQLRPLEDEELSLHAAALINRFRLAYVNHLAAREKGVFVPNGSLEPVSHQGVELFQQHLVESCVRHNRDWESLRGVLHRRLREEAGHDSTSESLEPSLELPPLGLYALMRVRSPDPVQWLQDTHEHFRDYNKLFRTMWKTSQEGMRRGGRMTTGARDIDDYHAEITDFFEDQQGRLADGRSVAWRKTGFRRYLGFVSSIAMKGVGAGFVDMEGIIGAVLEEGVGELGDQFRDWIEAPSETHVTQYNRLGTHLGGRLPVDIQSQLARRVEKVFGGPLVYR
ncbi:MAG: hypothetical protein ACLFO0_05970 [Guyparkeria sp.]